MKGRSSIAATSSIALRGVQPPACSCAFHSNGMTAEACRPGGYLAIWLLAQSVFSAVKAKSFGWMGSGARRRTDMVRPWDRARSLPLQGGGLGWGSFAPTSPIHLPEDD